jgi:hypothetical protein
MPFFGSIFYSNGLRGNLVLPEPIPKISFREFSSIWQLGKAAFAVLTAGSLGNMGAVGSQ